MRQQSKKMYSNICEVTACSKYWKGTIPACYVMGKQVLGKHTQCLAKTRDTLHLK